VAIDGIHWAFDVDAVSKRSMITKWISECPSVMTMYAALDEGREELEKKGKLRSVENFPSHESMRA
jgi:hypothetical protein